MALRKLKLTPEREKWVSNRNTALLGKTLNYNASAQIRYQRNITRLMRPMFEHVKNELLKFFKSRPSKKFFKSQEKLMTQESVLTQDAVEANPNLAVLAQQLLNDLQAQYDKEFNEQSKVLSQQMYEDMLKNSAVSLKTSLEELSGGLLIETSVIPKGLESISQAVIKQNVELIKTIPQQYFRELQGSVMRSITTEQGLDYLIPQIDSLASRNLRHTRNMALDQTRKAYNSINEQRMLAVGVTHYEWVHNGGSMEPRKDHIAMNGKRYSFAEPPIIDRRTGERGKPGDAINCRCTMRPIIEFDND